MTAAERKRAQRDRDKLKKNDSERRGLIAHLMRIYRRQQSVVVATRSRTNTDETRRAGTGRHQDSADDQRRAQDRARERKYKENLDALSLADLKLALDVAQTPDTHGRLHNERSGESAQRGGQSEIERIQAARNGVAVNDAFSKFAEDGSVIDDLGEQERLNQTIFASQAKVAPEGHSPDDSDKRDAMLDDADVAVRQPSPEYTPSKSEVKLDKRIMGIIKSMRRDPDLRCAAKCPFCDEHFDSELGAENHLRSKYIAMVKLIEYDKNFTELLALSGAVAVPSPMDPHYPGINAQPVNGIRLPKGRRKLAEFLNPDCQSIAEFDGREDEFEFRDDPTLDTLAA